MTDFNPFMSVAIIFFVYALYLFIKPNKKRSSIQEQDAEAYFFNKSEVNEDRVITGQRTNGIGFYKNENGKLSAVKQSKPCDLAIL